MNCSRLQVTPCDLGLIFSDALLSHVDTDL